MPYRKRYFHKRSYNPDKYSIEHTAVTINLQGDSGDGVLRGSQTVVPAILQQGMRKVKHLTVSFALFPNVSDHPLYWAVVYVPYQTNPNGLSLTSGGAFYEPSNFVMGCGIIDPQAGPNRIHIPLARNLNQGDRIELLVGTPNTSSQTVSVQAIVQYAVTLQ